MRRRILFFVPLALLAASCRQKEEQPLVARVGKAVITEAEFRDKLAEVNPDYQNYVLTPHGRRQFLDVLVREKLILQAARADGVYASPEFRDRMEQLRREEERKLDEARDYLLSKLWLDKLRRQGTLGVSDAEVAAFHKRNPTEVVVRHILLATAEEAEAVVKRVRSGESFPKLAQEHSLDSDTAADGGRMAPALFGEVIPELEIVFKMRLREIAGPVRSKFGYHVVVKEGERRQPLSAVKDRIRNILEKQKLDAHLQSLQAAFPVEVLDAQFR